MQRNVENPISIWKFLKPRGISICLKSTFQMSVRGGPLPSICSQIQKLRDVQQEREGTSLNYIKVLFNYIEQFSRSILIFVYLCLFWTFLVYLGASQCISVYLCLTRSILVYISLSWTILDYIRLYWTTLNYLELSWTISDNL